MITISRVYTFESSHWLPNVPEGHKCGRVHGHSYELTVSVSGRVSKKYGWVTDFSVLDAYVKPLVDALDHHTLNDTIPNPTSENLCLWFADALRDLNPSAIEISETRKSRARWTP